mmetsp:Transcript_32788/g.72450  ORF Transcript_32788/g.72450 Transcript_32788/m.72450 type:complete len:84 (+) Transcript_32788:941-1192(+)
MMHHRHHTYIRPALLFAAAPGSSPVHPGGRYCSKTKEPPLPLHKGSHKKPAQLRNPSIDIHSQAKTTHVHPGSNTADAATQHS